MKFFAVLAAAAIAVVSAADVPECDTTALLAAATGTDGTTCQSETGYSAATLSIPTGADLVKVCSNASCKKLLAAITAAVPTECTFSGIAIKSTLIDKFPAACAAATGGSSTGSGSGAASATVTTAPTTATTTASSAAADTTTAGSASSSSSTSATVPSSTTAVPTPTPTSSASAVAAATGAVVMAVAATLL